MHIYLYTNWLLLLYCVVQQWNGRNVRSRNGNTLNLWKHFFSTILFLHKLKHRFLSYFTHYAHDNFQMAIHSPCEWNFCIYCMHLVLTYNLHYIGTLGEAIRQILGWRLMWKIDWGQIGFCAILIINRSHLWGSRNNSIYLLKTFWNYGFSSIIGW